MEEENARLHSKINNLETELSLNLKQSLSLNGIGSLADTRNSLRAIAKTIPLDDKTGELISPRSPKYSPRRSAAFSPTRSLLSLNNKTSPQRTSSSNGDSNSNNNKDDNNNNELSEIPETDSIAKTAATGTTADSASNVHKDEETVKSKTCAIM